MTGYVFIGYGDLAFAAILLVVNAGLSIRLGLGLERQMLIAAARMTVQLLLIGLVLKFLFALASLWVTVLAMLVMAAVAGYEINARQEHRIAGGRGYGLGTLTAMTVGFLVTVFALAGPIRPDPWYAPHFAIPLFGMILGNAMTGISLGLSTLTTTMRRETASIEARLMLGETFWYAVRPVARQALRSGFMPIVNAMAATGIVALPGMMTGQILAGVDPSEAVKYQLLVMLLIGGGTGLGVLLAVFGAINLLTDDRDRLRLDRLHSG